MESQLRDCTGITCPCLSLKAKVAESKSAVLPDRATIFDTCHPCSGAQRHTPCLRLTSKEEWARQVVAIIG